jgi:hypothetical protein
MTNSTTTSMQKGTQSFSRTERRQSDAAPMVINRLSGWIDVGEVKTETSAWIIPTRIHGQSR